MLSCCPNKLGVLDIPNCARCCSSGPRRDVGNQLTEAPLRVNAAQLADDLNQLGVGSIHDV